MSSPSVVQWAGGHDYKTNVAFNCMATSGNDHVSPDNVGQDDPICWQTVPILTANFSGQYTPSAALKYCPSVLISLGTNAHTLAASHACKHRGTGSADHGLHSGVKLRPL